MSALSPASLSEDGDFGSRRISSHPVPDHTRSCKVCGDRANGYNFGVLTCESCKAFFRRNAIREEDIKCPFSSACGITSASRRFCQACRLRKCFAVGMSREWLNDQKPRQTAHSKRRLKTEPEEHSNSDEEISVSKAYLRELIRKSKSRPTCCECRCECGYYPSDTRLTALKESTTKNTSSSKPSSVSSSSPYASPATAFVPSPALNVHSSQKDFHPPNDAALTNDISTESPGLCSQFNSPNTIYHQQPPPPTYPHAIRNPNLGMGFQQGFPVQNQSGFVTLQGGFGISPLPSNVMLSAFSSIPQPYPHMSASVPPNVATFGPLISSAPPQDPSWPSPFQVKMSVNEYKQLLSRKTGSVEQMRYVNLPEEDKSLLQELVKANEPLKAPLDLQFNDELTLMDVVKITEAALKRIVCMTRDLSAFQKLTIEDKKHLMKGSCSELLILRGVMAFDPNKNSWNHNFSQGIKEMEVKLDVLKKTKETQHYEEHKKFLAGFTERIRKNENIMLILMALVIFQPDRPNIRDVETVRETQKIYNRVLLRVLQCEYPDDEARQVYDILLRRLSDLQNLNQGLVRIYYGFDSSQLDPLIKELFDI